MWQDVLAAHHDAVAQAIECHGGYVDAIQGDAFVAAFADARGAVDAALDAQRALAAAAWPRGIEPLRVRMGVHTGYVERTELGYVGLEVHRAARVGAAAHGGQILVTAATCALLCDETEVEDLGEHRLKDFPRPQRLFHVVRDGCHATEFGPLHTAEARPTNLPEDLMALVGRDGELDHLQALLGDGVRFVTLVGAGGAGKTRLALALARRMLDDLPGGAFVVALAPVSDPAGVLPAVAARSSSETTPESWRPASRRGSARGGRCSCSTTSSRSCPAVPPSPSCSNALGTCACSSPARRRCTCAARPS